MATMQLDGQPVGSRLEDAKEKLGFADAQLLELDELTSQLRTLPRTDRQWSDVCRVYLGWLVFTRQVGASIDAAWQAAGSPPGFGRWWAERGEDPTHAFFRHERNAGLKGAEEIVNARSIIDERFAPVAYWTFARGPHQGEPLVPRCQLYNDWLYYSLWAPAAQLLFDWTLAERLSPAAAV